MRRPLAMPNPYAAALVAAALACSGPGTSPSPSAAAGGYPKIANCYGSALAWNPQAATDPYLSKVQLFIGQGYDFHYDWDDPAITGRLPALTTAVAGLKAARPDALVLSYVDVAEGPFDPALPSSWWRLDASGNKVSTWPGFYQIRTELPEVMAFDQRMVAERLAAHPALDGVFFDVWSIDETLVPAAGALRDGRFLTMVNTWNLADAGMDRVNGVLSEDELDRVMAGQVPFDDFLRRYLAWSTASRKPVLTTLVCHPRTLNDDPWRWSQLPEAERQAELAAARTADPQMLRFGLSVALLGDGYFAYDAGTMSRGSWWWYREYDAPLGTPTAGAARLPSGLWHRPFTTGEVFVNPTSAPVAVTLPAARVNASTGARAAAFTVGAMDGLIVSD